MASRARKTRSKKTLRKSRRSSRKIRRTMKQKGCGKYKKMKGRNCNIMRGG